MENPQSTVSRFEAKLDTVLGIVQKIEISVALQKRDIEDLRCDHDDLCEDVKGNGKPGLEKDVINLQRDVKAINEFLDGLRRLTWIVIGVLASLIVTDIVFLVVTHPVPGVTK